MKKILILTDSNGNPRDYPISDSVSLEETYPYLLRKRYPDDIFYQLSFGNITTEELTSQATSYLKSWEPDIILVHSGINDCRPEAFTDFEKESMKKMPSLVSRALKKNLNNPKLIKFRQVERVTESSFGKTVKKFKMLFNKSKIFWFEIAVGPDYESVRPGVTARMLNYNQIISDVYGDDMIRTLEHLISVNGFNADSLHINRNGHNKLFKECELKIDNYFC